MMSSFIRATVGSVFDDGEREQKIEASSAFSHSLSHAWERKHGTTTGFSTGAPHAGNTCPFLGQHPTSKYTLGKQQFELSHVGLLI